MARAQGKITFQVKHVSAAYSEHEKKRNSGRLRLFPELRMSQCLGNSGGRPSQRKLMAKEGTDHPFLLC